MRTTGILPGVDLVDRPQKSVGDRSVECVCQILRTGKIAFGVERGDLLVVEVDLDTAKSQETAAVHVSDEVKRPCFPPCHDDRSPGGLVGTGRVRVDTCEADETLELVVAPNPYEHGMRQVIGDVLVYVPHDGRPADRQRAWAIGIGVMLGL